MAIKNVIAQGIGFASDGVKWIPTHGFGVGEAVVTVGGPFCVLGYQFGDAWLAGYQIGDAWLVGSQIGDAWLVDHKTEC